MYIKREDALKELRLDHKDVIYIDKNECARRIKAIPSADRPSGEWIDDIEAESNGDYWANCSRCGMQIDVHENRGYYNYCPNCGARMRGADDE